MIYDRNQDRGIYPRPGSYFIEEEDTDMAMYDWNGNGNKSDMADNFIEYQIYKDCTSGSHTPRTSNSTSGMGFWIVFIIACVVDALCGGLGVLIMLVYGVLKLLGM